MNAVQTMFELITTQVQDWMIPMAIGGVLLWGIAYLVIPLLPEWASGMRGTMQKTLLIVGFLGVVPGLVAGLAALGGC